MTSLVVAALLLSLAPSGPNTVAAPDAATDALQGTTIAASSEDPAAASPPAQGGTTGAGAAGECGLQPCTPEVPNAPPPRPGKGLRIAAIPVVAYGSDTGLRLAAGVFVYKLREHDLRASWAAIQLSWTSRGPRYAEVKGELRDVFGSQLRSFYQLKLHDDVAAPYWGEGANLAGGPPPGAGAPPAPYQYHVAGPWLATTLRGPMRGPVAWFVRARWTRRNISQRGEILQAEHPVGYDGGGIALGAVGLVYDTRDDEVGVSRGIFADGSVFAAPHLPGFSEQGFVGVNATVREYVPLWSGATFAMRQLYENKGGDVPFSERTLLEGLGYGEGIGGAGTIRGLARDRLAGEEKMLASFDVRANFLRTSWFGRRQDFGASAGGDIGRARQRGYDPVTAAGVFGGLRLLWDRAVLVRFEVGWAGQGAAAYYLSFDEPF